MIFNIVVDAVMRAGIGVVFGPQEVFSSPRKEKNSKPPTGENLVPSERTIKINPKGGETRRNTQEGISGDHE